MEAAIRAVVLGALMATPLLTKASADGLPRNYAAGQVWRYDTRPEDLGSLLRIAEIDRGWGLEKIGVVYHISVIGVHFQGSALANVIGDLPVSRETLDKSVTELTKSDAIFPDATEGIRQWREAKGGVFSISVAEIVRVVGQMAQDSPHKPQSH